MLCPLQLSYLTVEWFCVFAIPTSYICAIVSFWGAAFFCKHNGETSRDFSPCSVSHHPVRGTDGGQFKTVIGARESLEETHGEFTPTFKISFKFSKKKCCVMMALRKIHCIYGEKCESKYCKVETLCFTQVREGLFCGENTCFRCVNLRQISPYFDLFWFSRTAWVSTLSILWF